MLLSTNSDHMRQVDCAASAPAPAALAVQTHKAEPREGLRYLNAAEYSDWDRLVEVSHQGSIFCRSWWLKAVEDQVCVLGYFEKDRLVAGIPLHFEKILGM